MSIVSLILVLVLIGVVLYVVNSLIPMDSRIKTIINIVVILVVLYWILSVFGVVPAASHISIFKV